MSTGGDGKGGGGGGGGGAAAPTRGGDGGGGGGKSWWLLGMEGRSTGGGGGGGNVSRPLDLPRVGVFKPEPPVGVLKTDKDAFNQTMGKKVYNWVKNKVSIHAKIYGTVILRFYIQRYQIVLSNLELNPYWTRNTFTIKDLELLGQPVG